MALETAKRFLFALLITWNAWWGIAYAGGDGQIAYLRFSEKYWQIWIMDAADGEHCRQITWDPGDKVNLSWGNLGREILYNTNQGEMHIVRVSDGAQRNVPLSLTGMTDGDWSHHGKEIVFSLNTVGSIDNNDIWIGSVDGKTLKKVTRLPGLQHDPVWWTGSRQIVFLSGEGKENHNIFIVDREGKLMEQLTADDLYNFETACSSQGEIAFSSNRSGNYDIWVMDQKGQNVSQLTVHPGFDSSPSWSPDASQLVFVSDRSGHLQLWKMNRDGSELRQLTDSQMGCRSPAWSRP
ncbi:MAG: TolB family protein [Thermodesulfovibrionia bacterium]|nr:TolB family protein [Thermodesulfovibrionia bacterium]